MPKKPIIQDVIENSSNRRKFINRLGIAGAVGALAVSASPAGAQTPSDTDILNFALNLEYLEAEFYTVATTGQTISNFGIGTTGVGTSGATTGGRLVNLRSDEGHEGHGKNKDQDEGNSTFTREVALQIAFDERAHVTLLRNALGSAAIAKPAINLDALGFGFNNQRDFLVLARALEDVGVTAYAGAAPLISSRTILGVAARILATEAEHSGNVRLQIAQQRIPTTALDGVDILPPPSGTNFFSVDNNALVQVRTPGQVLFLVYGFMAGVMRGGFFPNGVNGPINTSSASA